MTEAAPGRETASPRASSPDRLLEAKEVAELLSVPESWVRDATRSGWLPHIRLGRYVRYQQGAVLDWIQDQRSETPHPRLRRGGRA